jgi:hypothetical protein
LRPTVVSSTPVAISGDSGQVLEVRLASTGARSVALVTHDGRAYVVSAEGFAGLSPDGTNDARQIALYDFLARLTFLAS